MSSVTCACVQMRSSTTPDENASAVVGAIQKAAAKKASLIVTPEMTNFMDIRKGQSRAKAVHERDDKCLAAIRETAAKESVWVLIGSLALAADQTDQLINRSFLIGPDGQIKARYDKIHMFDVDVGDGHSYRESSRYAAGEEAIVVQTPIGAVGMSICYDLRFGYLYRMLAQAGAQILVVPAAFTKVTGEVHWEIMLRARAIETGCFILAAGQGGQHEDGRETYGNSMIISPWGEILSRAGTDPDIISAELDLSAVATARQRIPALQHDRQPTLKIIEDE